MAETTAAQRSKETQRTQEAAQQRVQQIEKEGLLRRFLNFFKRLFGGSSTASQSPTSDVNGQEANKETLLDSWDALTDKADQLQQTLKNELQDLNDGKPSPPQGGHPDELSAYQAELQSFDQRIEQTADRYALAISQLQQERDGLVAQARNNNQTLPNIDEMDAKLGADAEGPGHAPFKALRQEVSDALNDTLAPDSLSSPNSEIVFEEGIVRGGDSRMAIGDRMLEIVQQGLANGNGIDQKALDREFTKLMPAAEEGTIGRRYQMEQKANLAFASTMTGVLQQYLTNTQSNHDAMPPAELKGLREQALDNEQLLALTDIEAQNIPFEANTELRVDAFRIERQSEMTSFQEGYAALVNQAELASVTFEPPAIRQFEATEGVDLIRSQEERDAIAMQIRDLVLESTKARNNNHDGTEASLAKQVDYWAVDKLLEPLTRTYQEVELTEGDALNQLRNAELAETLLSSVKAVDRTSDMQHWPNQVALAVATSNPSQEELKQYYLDDNGKVDKSMIREHSEKTLSAYQRNITTERKEPSLDTPTMSM